jgi:hypothetical protein
METFNFFFFFDGIAGPCGRSEDMIVVNNFITAVGMTLPLGCHHRIMHTLYLD